MRQSNVFPQRTCTHCHSLTIHWLWRLVEPAPHTYEILCVVCVAEQDATFNAQSALDQAEAIISTSQLFNRHGVANDWRTE
jgi:hypothetical protein